MGIFGIAKRGKGIAKKIKQGKEWDILKKHPTLAKQSYSKSAINKMLSKDFKKNVIKYAKRKRPRPLQIKKQ